jgi:hypothetical protein
MPVLGAFDWAHRHFHDFPLDDLGDENAKKIYH